MLWLRICEVVLSPILLTCWKKGNSGAAMFFSMELGWNDGPLSPRIVIVWCCLSIPLFRSPIPFCSYRPCCFCAIFTPTRNQLSKHSLGTEKSSFLPLSRPRQTIESIQRHCICICFIERLIGMLKSSLSRKEITVLKMKSAVYSASTEFFAVRESVTCRRRGGWKDTLVWGCFRCAVKRKRSSLNSTILTTDPSCSFGIVLWKRHFRPESISFSRIVSICLSWLRKVLNQVLLYGGR